ncbi:sigma-70 family RNA polymerase sigma factor [Longispora urticae]
MTVLPAPPPTPVTPETLSPARPWLTLVPAPRAASRPLASGRREAAPVNTEELLRDLRALPTGHPDRAGLRSRAIEHNLPLARRLALRYVLRGEPLDDLIQVACLALIKAVDGYDPTRQIPFVGYATPTILGTLKRHFRDTTWGMRVPRAAQELARAVAVATGELGQQLGHWPTPAELAAHLHVTVESLRFALGASQAYHPASLEVLRADGEAVDLGGFLGAADPGYEAVDEDLSHQPLLARLACLPLRERRILTLRYYDQLTQSQIAAEVGLSQMHVSRLLKLSLAQLRTGLTRP